MASEANGNRAAFPVVQRSVKAILFVVCLALAAWSLGGCASSEVSCAMGPGPSNFVDVVGQGGSAQAVVLGQVGDSLGSPVQGGPGIKVHPFSFTAESVLAFSPSDDPDALAMSSPAVDAISEIGVLHFSGDAASCVAQSARLSPGDRVVIAVNASDSQKMWLVGGPTDVLNVEGDPGAEVAIWQATGKALGCDGDISYQLADVERALAQPGAVPPTGRCDPA